MQQKKSNSTKKKTIKTKRNEDSSSKDATKPHSRLSKAILVAILAIISVSVIITAYSYGVINTSSNVHLSVFLSNMKHASHIALYIDIINNSVYVNSAYCATSLIYQIMKSNYTHRDPSTINFFITNESNDSCIYSLGLKNASNYTHTTYSRCISMSKGTPSIFIDYNKINKTVVHKNALYINGTVKYLLECGVSAQMR